VGLLIKICGFTTPEGIAAAVEAGVDSIWLVLDPSPRQLTVERARELKAHIPEGVEVVAVCGRPTVEELRRIQRDLAPDSIQLMADALPSESLGIPILPAFEDGPDLIERVERYRAQLNEDRPLVLADGPNPGSGIAADWGRVEALTESTRLMIAGGLTPENVGDAIDQLRPFGVDVSSGVEQEVGRKSPQRIRDFVAAVRAAEAALTADG
jgi:phosphoribosylanthranilate isomerase